MKLNTTKFHLDSRTYYLLNAEGEGCIVSTADDLDRVSDAVAQDIGFPIDHGTWLEGDAAMALPENAMFVNFSVSELCLEEWKASR